MTRVVAWLTSRSWRAWLLFAAIAVVVASFTAGALRARVGDLVGGARTGITGALEELRDARAQLATSQEATRAMARRIQELAVEADAARARADRAGADAARWSGEAAGLRARVADLEAARRALAAPRSAREAADALRALGYAAEVRP